MNQAETDSRAALDSPPRDARPLVLVVDDRAVNRQFVSLVLKDQCRVKEAADGEIALRLARDADMPDLILLDLTMPLIDGQEVLRQLRADPGTRDIPVIVLTGDDREESETACLELGADDFLVRPFRSNALLLRARNLLQRRRLQLDLAASITRARRIFEVAPNPMLVVDADGRIQQANARAELVFGYGPGELAGEAVETLIPSPLREGHAQARDAFGQSPGTRMMGHRELRGLRRSGEEFPLLAGLSPLGSGERIQVIVGINDLTERQVFEARLRESDDQYRQLFMTMAQGVVTHDAEGVIVDVNPAACEILGLNREAFLGPDSRFPGLTCIREDGSEFPPAQQPAHVARLTGQAVGNELMGIYRPDEQRHRWVLVSAKPLFRQGGQQPYQVHATFIDVTSRREMQEAYRREQQLNTAIVESSGGVLVVMDRAGRVVRVNAAVERLTGFGRDQLLGHPIWEWLVPPERVAGVKAMFDALPTRSIPDEYDDEWLTRDGGRIPLHCFDTVLGDGADQAGHIVLQGHDMRALKAAQEALRLSEERQRIATEGVKDGVWDWNLEDDSVYYSPAWLAMLGYGPDELAPRLETWKQLVHPDDEALALGACAEYLDGHGDWMECEIRMRHRDGHWVHVLSRASLARDENQRPLTPRRLIGTHSDITQRKRFEREVRESNNRFRTLFESSPFPILVSEAGHIIDSNRAATALFGYADKQEILNQHLGQLSPERQPDGEASVVKAERMMVQVLEHGSRQFEWVHRRKDGSEMLTEVTLSPLEIDGRTFIYAHLRDITQAKADEATIRHDREQQALLRALLEDGFSEIPLATLLKQGLERLLSLSWLRILPKGAVFLAQGPREPLRLVAEHNLAPELKTLCAQVPMGHCLCGRAGATRQMQYAHCVDARHETTYPGIEDHGHYSLPLLVGDELLGVLVLYLPIGFQRNEIKEEFLRAVGNVLAAIIRRKQDMQVLREREQLYRNVVETSLDGFFMTNSEGRVMEANASYQRLSGYSHEELLGLHVADLEASENADDVAAHIVRIVQRGADLFETRHRSKDGRTWPVEMSVSYLPFNGGRFFAFARDIGPREEMRQSLLRSQHSLEEQVVLRTAELEASRQQLASIIDNLPAILFIKDLDGRYLSVNRCYEREVGFAKERVIGGTDRDLFPAAMARRLGEVERQALASGQAITLEESVLTHNGLKHDYLTTKLPLLDAAGEAYALLGIAVDITQIKTLQAQLSRAQALAHLGSWRLDIARGEMECSEETYRIFDFDPGTPVSLDRFSALLDPEDREAKRRAWEAALRGEPYDVEFRVRTDKRTLWVREQAHIKFGETGIPVLAEGSVQDVTEIEQAREALENAASEAHRVARVKSEFLANMSHEIRTPLNGILGLAQVGLRQNVGRQSQRLFDQILDSGQLLLGIVNDILDFSKIEAGKLRVEMVDVQLDHLIQHVSVMCSDRASAKGFLLRIERSESLPAWFKGDPLRIAQILINLVGNAIKFTEQGEVVLSIASAAGQIVFTVRDTGIGMSEAHMANLFTPFEQADGSTTRRFGGTGLGLAITHRLVELMQGDIQVHSIPGVGSTFVVGLPLTASSGPSQTEEFALPAEAAAGTQKLAGLRLLAAEDNVVNRMVLEDMLVLEGAVLLCAENGQEALEIVQREGEAAWDMVLTDIHMPIMNGHQLAQALRQIAPGLPVVGVTAHAMAEEQQRCLDSGMVAHVAKPIVMEELVNVILQHARRRPGSPSPTATPDESSGASAPGRAEQAAPDVAANATSCPTERYFDRAALLSHHRGREDFIEKLLGMVAKSHATTPARLRAASAGHDFKELAFVAHSFAGVAASVLAKSLHAAAKAVELQARAEAPDAFGQALVLADEVEAFLAALERSLKPV